MTTDLQLSYFRIAFYPQMHFDWWPVGRNQIGLLHQVLILFIGVNEDYIEA